MITFLTLYLGLVVEPATQPERRLETGKAFFSASADVLPVARGLGMGGAGLRVRGDDRPERLADAVAAAGLEVAGSGRRRVVLLVADPETPDASAFSSRQAQLYLAAAASEERRQGLEPKATRWARVSWTSTPRP